MASLADKIYLNSPHFFQGILISFYNYRAYKARYGKFYKDYLNEYKQSEKIKLNELLEIQDKKLVDLFNHAKNNSQFYYDLYKDIHLKEGSSLNDIEKLPIINKELLRKNISNISTIPKNQGVISKTGGTTGKSLEVIYTKKNLQERFAILDLFRNSHGYELGKKTAWFSGKNLLSKKDIKKNRFWKTDSFHNVRYYSTFHIHQKYLKFYIENLIRYKPEFMVGFPSTMYELAKYGIDNKISFPSGTIKAIFPTAETITQELRFVIESFFKTRLYNQYASSEGAPFIIECNHGRLHQDLRSGVFEVLDENNKPTNKGRLVVTSFTSYGTPLIRYDIGDVTELTNEKCTCGNSNPIVKSILGRISDYIYSEEMGKINLGNVSNCLKGVTGVIKFQVIQNVLHEIDIIIQTDESFKKKDELVLLRNFRYRLGNKLKINLIKSKNIHVEKSGKFRIVKNNLNL